VTADPISASPALDSEGNVYVGSEDRQFYTFDSSGALRWSYGHPGVAEQDFWTSSPVISTAGEICIQARRSLAAFNSVGVLTWSFSTYAPEYAHPSSPAIGSDGRLYWGTGTVKAVYAIDSDITLAWSYLTGGTLESSPAVGAEGSIYIGCYDNNIYALTADGLLSWSYLTTAKVHSSPALDTAENVYVGSRDNIFYAFTSTGALSWSYETADKNIDSSPSIDARDWIYVGAQDSSVYVFESNGTIVWTYMSVGSFNSSPAIGSGGMLYIGCNDNNIHAL